MCLVYILSIILVVTATYIVYNNYNSLRMQYEATKIEGFYPRRWWWGYNNRWAWQRPYYYEYGNWRPYGNYPAYSGYWKQCPNGTWCPQTVSCMSPACY